MAGIVSLGTESGENKTTKGTLDTYFCLSNGKYVFVEYSTTKNNIVNGMLAHLIHMMDIFIRHYG